MTVFSLSWQSQLAVGSRSIQLAVTVCSRQTQPRNWEFISFGSIVSKTPLLSFRRQEKSIKPQGIDLSCRTNDINRRSRHADPDGYREKHLPRFRKRMTGQ